jgi:hypothetical protein
VPATRQPRPSQRRENDPDPFNVDMTEVPMTPAMETLHQVAILRAHANAIHQFLDECVLDGTELTLAEGQTQTFVLRAQGRPFSWRSQLAKILLRRRGISVASQNWRTRTKDLEPERVPSYMNHVTLSALRRHIEPLARAVEAASELRRNQYPAVHERAKAAIEGPPAAKTG